MGGKRGKRSSNSNSEPVKALQSANSLPMSTSEVSEHQDLGYKLRVLIHDLVNMTKNPTAVARLNSTTDEHYISLPYFTPEEGLLVRNAIIDTEPDLYHVPSYGGFDHNDDDNDQADGKASTTTSLATKHVHEALSTILSTFLEKRRASGDARPCGPHHLAPLYAALFGIALEEIQDAGFLTRLRKNGL
ncbi:hypothetical protein NQ176_g7203 [Zarea fungicola]|uniref:Uncharacterized protein n=1 Tax=Zarea fungicola TaxID=93591 RepID=A0ACC1MZC1_9HYPO|nr:hypothetical protein NQ176_g7203 [Lecanicillium fungicola]